MSSERAALIAAIRESPDDDGLRLMCSDWFEEQGDEASVARAGRAPQQFPPVDGGLASDEF